MALFVNKMSPLSALPSTPVGKSSVRSRIIPDTRAAERECIINGVGSDGERARAWVECDAVNLSM